MHRWLKFLEKKLQNDFSSRNLKIKMCWGFQGIFVERESEIKFEFKDFCQRTLLILPRSNFIYSYKNESWKFIFNSFPTI